MQTFEMQLRMYWHKYKAESGYADDVDFIYEDSESLARLIPLTSRVLKDMNLFVNEGKTENTRIYM